MLNKLKESDEHMNFPVSNNTKLKQFKCQMTYLCILLLILNPKCNNFYLKKCLIVKRIFGFSLTVKKELRTFPLRNYLEIVNGYTIFQPPFPNIPLNNYC